MRILMLGDVVGEGGRRLVEAFVPELRREARVDFVVVNGENAAHGHGITERIAREWLDDLGVDVITTGNHVWKQKDLVPLMEEEPHVLRPANYPKGAPGRGHTVIETPDGRKLGVINLEGRVFMRPLDNPFALAPELVAELRATFERHGLAGEVLLVDDEAPLRTALRGVLEDEGFRVFEAVDGAADGVQQGRGAPDVVFPLGQLRHLSDGDPVVDQLGPGRRPHLSARNASSWVASQTGVSCIG